MKKELRVFLIIASVMMALAIVIGAFGAHVLKTVVDEPLLKIYNTGVQYHFYNTLGLFVASFVIYLKPNSKRAVIAVWLMFIGTVIFSFSLYLLVLLKMPTLGAITPIGGSLLIISWLLLSFSIYKD